MTVTTAATSSDFILLLKELFALEEDKDYADVSTREDIESLTGYQCTLALTDGRGTIRGFSRHLQRETQVFFEFLGRDPNSEAKCSGSTDSPDHVTMHRGQVGIIWDEREIEECQRFLQSLR